MRMTPSTDGSRAFSGSPTPRSRAQAHRLRVTTLLTWLSTSSASWTRATRCRLDQRIRRHRRQPKYQFGALSITLDLMPLSRGRRVRGRVREQESGPGVRAAAALSQHAGVYALGSILGLALALVN